MVKIIRPIITSVAVFTILTGLIYPLFVTAIAQIFFPGQANGSLIHQDGMAIGSSLIGQPFDDPKYFWGRPSATSPFPYNGAASSGSNLAQSNPALIVQARSRIRAIQDADPEASMPAPVDLVTASASGLDPHISPDAAFYQVKRIALKRGMDGAVVRALVASNIEDRQLGVFGEKRVNVLKLNLALDELQRQ